jgi:hypothetical protein
MFNDRSWPIADWPLSGTRTGKADEAPISFRATDLTWQGNFKTLVA